MENLKHIKRDFVHNLRIPSKLNKMRLKDGLHLQ